MKQNTCCLDRARPFFCVYCGVVRENKRTRHIDCKCQIQLGILHVIEQLFSNHYNPIREHKVTKVQTCPTKKLLHNADFRWDIHYIICRRVKRRQETKQETLREIPDWYFTYYDFFQCDEETSKFAQV